ncbi:glycine reductase [Acetoanaerobium pronyense]|uniref:Glycine reductase n=1 Tax=Acetoanaerobium pronyense TaxID=1482736 RepID=A0ABS4KGU4_9FIRM|nr:glycine/sarcosine/betaine reductase complex component C subunit alpha [Acetoanaerobium pronyense]MBP2027002.1 glycine reductase [Acetoanaerobium pronyense]
MELNKLIGNAFLEIADAIETGNFGKTKKVALTTLGSEHGEDTLIEGAKLASKLYPDLKIVLIGPKNDSGLETLVAETEEEMYKIMEEKLDNKDIGACITMHYNFPIGVSTVGRVVTPSKGKEMFIATTTGTSSAHRIEAMVKNAIYGIIAAKASGIENPTVGILNVDGARTVEKILKEIKAQGYNINFGESQRSDGGNVLRGNDLLLGTVDVIVTDTLTGNILMKLFSSFTSGGQYEISGYGYGPGIGEGYNRNVLILSRASGAPVIANALKYGHEIANNNINDIAAKEFDILNKINWMSIVAKATEKQSVKKEEKEEIKIPDKVVVTGSISGIDIMELEDAVAVLWKNNIYAESGMGCTGPIVLVPEDKVKECQQILTSAGYAAGEGDIC